MPAMCQSVNVSVGVSRLFQAELHAQVGPRHDRPLYKSAVNCLQPGLAEQTNIPVLSLLVTVVHAAS